MQCLCLLLQAECVRNINKCWILAYLRCNRLHMRQWPHYLQWGMPPLLQNSVSLNFFFYSPFSQVKRLNMARIGRASLEHFQLIRSSFRRECSAIAPPFLLSLPMLTMWSHSDRNKNPLKRLCYVWPGQRPSGRNSVGISSHSSQGLVTTDEGYP